MVISEKQRSAKKPAKQGVAEDAPEPIKIRASTPYDFDSKNLTAYGGLLPVATMLEKLKFQQLVEVQRQMRQRVWEAANVKLSSVTFDTDTTVHTVYGKQMGARKSYNPK